MASNALFSLLDWTSFFMFLKIILDSYGTIQYRKKNCKNWELGVHRTRSKIGGLVQSARCIVSSNKVIILNLEEMLVAMFQTGVEYC